MEGVVYGANLVRIEPRGSDTYEVTMSLDKSIVNDLRVLYLERAFRPPRRVRVVDMRFRGKPATFLVGLTLSVSCLAGDAEPSAASGQQELASVRLEQIKERLIEAAFGSGVNVRSVAYLTVLAPDSGRFFLERYQSPWKSSHFIFEGADGDRAIGKAELPLEKACDVWEAQEKREKGVVKVSTRVKTSRRVSENAIPESKRKELTALLDQILTNEGFNVVHGDGPQRLAHLKTPNTCAA